MKLSVVDVESPLKYRLPILSISDLRFLHISDIRLDNE